MPWCFRTAAAGTARKAGSSNTCRDGEDGVRHLRLDRRAALVRRAHLHHRPVLRRAHAGGAGLPRSARAGGAGAGLRRLQRRLGKRHPPVRRVRAEAGHLGAPRGAAVARGRRRPGAARGAGGRGHPRLVHRHALAARPLAAAPPSRLRGLSCSSSGATARATAFWQQVGIWAEGFHHRYSRADCVHLSSWFDPYLLTATGNYRGLKRAGRGRQRLILGPVDAWRPQRAACSATSISAPRRRSTPGPATGSPTACGISTR